MPIIALVRRILCQLKHDKRTLALLFAAPLLILSLLYFVLNDSSTCITVAAVNCPLQYIERLEAQDVTVLRLTDAAAQQALYEGEITAAVTLINDELSVRLDGSNAVKGTQTLSMLQAALAPAVIISDVDVDYVYGYEGLTTFDNFGAVLIGVIIFFFVFLIAGISFLQERTSGTLDKLLSTPIRRWQIVAGYVLGFGIVTGLQAVLITLWCVYVLGVMMVGSFFLVLLTAVLAAVTALTLGILLSSIANNEFQMIQFVPIVIIPQVVFSGLFELSPGWEVIGWVMPLHYVADALTAVMIKGAGLGDIAGDLLFLVVCALVFMMLNNMVLKKYRDI